MIQHVIIHGYKSLKDVSVDLQSLTVIFGPNAAGKSNLFDALALLSRMATRRTLREAFEDHRGAPLEAFFHGEQGIEILLMQPSAQFSIQVDVALSRPVVDAVDKLIQDMRKGLPEGENGSSTKQRIVERKLRYSLTVQIQTDTGHLRVMNERLCALNNDGTEKQSRNAFVERSDVRSDKLSLRMEGQAHPSYHDIGLDHTLISTPLYPPHYPHITAFREELARWRFYYLEPKRLMRSDNPLQEVQSLDSTGANLAAFFNSLKINNRAQFETVNRVLPVLLPRVDRIDVERTKTGELQLRVYEGGVSFPASIVSEGTLRILGLLAITSALTPASVVGYEEPENGVHPRRLKLIADLIKSATEATDTQFLVNTHSPDFSENFDSRQLINCRKNGANTIYESIGIGGLFDLPDKENIEQGFEEGEYRPLSFSERIRRGDYSG